MKTICAPEIDGENHASSWKDESMLECTANMRFCHAKNLYIDFSGFVNPPPDAGWRYYLRHRPDLWREGQIGGKCRMDNQLLKQQAQHVAHGTSLRTWYLELEHYDTLQNMQCDEVIEEPVVFQKLDAAVNMYHHFCDFFNLYLSMHLNGSFSQSMRFIMWDTSSLKYGDWFRVVYNAFTSQQLLMLRQFAGKRVCFKDAVFSFMARMVGGHYYNYYTQEGCKGSGLYIAFRDFLLHRLGVPVARPNNDNLRHITITMISRGHARKERIIENEIELYTAIRHLEDVEVRLIDYNYKVPFLEQLSISAHSDIIIGIHGAGLTHMLFQPDWGVVFEVYNTEDKCYQALAKLRGLNYVTWEREELMVIQKGDGTYPKMYNYSFNVEEFVRLTMKAIRLVRDHKAFKVTNDEADRDEL